MNIDARALKFSQNVDLMHMKSRKQFGDLDIDIDIDIDIKTDIDFDIDCLY